MKKPENSAIASLLLAGFGYALYGPLTRIVGQDFDPVTQTFIRSILRIFIVILFLRISPVYTVKNISPHDRKNYGLLGFFAALTTLSYIPAIMYLSLGTTMLFFYASGTISSYIAGHFLYRERLSRPKITALIFALIGITLISPESASGGKPFYVILAIISGASYGLYSSFSKTISSLYSPNIMIMGVLLVEMILYGIIWVFSGETIVWKWQPWAGNLLYSIDVVGVTYLVFYGFRYLEAQIGSLLLLSELVFIILIGIIFYREFPSLMQLLGGCLITIGLIIPNITRQKTQIR